MAEIQPFKGLRYNTKKVDLKDIITEPYDRITPTLQEDYYRRSPYNIVRIILGKDNDPENPEKDKYRRADIFLKKWEKEGIFVREVKEAVYVYDQEYLVNGAAKKRRGLIARVKLEEFASRKVLPHEKTFPKHKEDRLRLLRATNTNTEQIFLLYTDDNKKVGQAIERALKKAELAADVRDEDGFQHRLWVISDGKDISRIQETMAEKVLIIADGHHRYETSLNYRAEMLQKLRAAKGDEPFNSIMMTLFDLHDPGLVILPTFRLAKGLEKFSEEGFKGLFAKDFEISDVDWSSLADKTTLNKVRAKIENETHTFGAYRAGAKKIHLLRLKSEGLLDKEVDPGKSAAWKRLDVAILHSLIIDKLAAFTEKPFVQDEQVGYVRNLEEGLKKVADGEWQVIFLLKPCSLQQIRQVVEKGELMPHKSTDFFPKLKSGLVLNPLDD
jgi:uncharacterized protein (DUF1015 family)